MTAEDSILLEETSTDPQKILHDLMSRKEIPMHGPVHHFLDGAAFLTALHNAGVMFDLAEALEALRERNQSMPGATCGHWGVCGSASSLGAALAILRKTGPLSDNDYYKDNLRLTSRILAREAELGGPRCCKRNGYTALDTATDFVKEMYGIELERPGITCDFYPQNKTCLGEKCPYHPV